ncbi:MAG TPA: hypothetical protein VGA00_02840 [Acidiferrobacterales bacterium]
MSLIGAPVFAAKKDAAPDIKTAQAKCERWATETKVPDAERKTYIKDCVRELTVPDPKKEGGGDE